MTIHQATSAIGGKGIAIGIAIQAAMMAGGGGIMYGEVHAALVRAEANVESMRREIKDEIESRHRADDHLLKMLNDNQSKIIDLLRQNSHASVPS